MDHKQLLLDLRSEITTLLPNMTTDQKIVVWSTLELDATLNAVAEEVERIAGNTADHRV